MRRSGPGRPAFPGSAAADPIRRRLLAAAALSMAVAVALLAAWTARLDRELAARWDARRPELPSRVYSAPTRLYPGLAVEAVDLPGTLAALGYRAGAGERPAPGTYRLEGGWGGGRLTVHLHDFAYPEGPAPGFPLEIVLRDGRIAALADDAAGRPLPTARLEPQEVATLLDARMVSRHPVTLEEVPPVLVEAILAVEDRRFFSHRGLDLRRIAGAALRNVREGGYAEGGSTLTQQLVKNYFLGREKTLRRKAKEAVMALLFEARHSKREILEAYLNEVYLGQRGPSSLVGVGEASRHWFSREVGQLGLAEAALLAGMIRGPALYDPSRHPERARARRDAVLGMMEEEGLISGEERARAAEAALPRVSPSAPIRGAPWYTDLVVSELGERFAGADLEREGFRIFTSLDPRAQRAADRAVAEGLAALEEAYPHLEAGPDGDGPQAALVAFDPGTGELLAVVGGRDFGASQFNRAVRARRQPGSAFKPFVYLAALSSPDGRWSLASPIADSALSLTLGGRRWSPENHDRAHHGTVPLREALVHSYNVATVRLALEAGLPEVVETARRVGIRSRLRPVPSIALGAFEVTPLELAAAYSVLATGGARAEPLSILEVVGPDGTIRAASRLRFERVAAAGPVHLVNRALQGVLEEGTAASAAALGYRGTAAGKTGTSSGYRDAWFVGYTPGLVAVVWVGYDDNRSLRLTGAQAALPLWVRFVRAYRPGPSRDFTPPPGVVRVAVDRRSGKLAHQECGPWRMEVFLEGTTPIESCREGDG